MTAIKKSYIELIIEAITSIKDRTGSSPQAIKAYITSKHPSFKFQQVYKLLSIVSFIFIITVI